MQLHIPCPCPMPRLSCRFLVTKLMFGSLQAMEKELAAGGALDTYEFEGPDRPEFVQDLAEFQLAAVCGPTAPPACACLQGQRHP